MRRSCARRGCSCLRSTCLLRHSNSGRASVNFPSDACPCGGHIGWIQHEDRFVGNCYGRCRKRHVELKRETDDDLRRRTREAVWERRFREAGMEVPTGIAAACVQTDRLKTENARLRDELERGRVDVAAERAINRGLAP
jgi:hypothetical protein